MRPQDVKKRKVQEKIDDRRSLHSDGIVFTFSKDYLFCGKSLKSTSRQNGYKQAFKVRTRDFQGEIYKKCKERNNDWGQVVLTRIEYLRGLLASGTLYHQSCSVKCRKGRGVLDDNLSEPIVKKRRGRHLNSEKEPAFPKVLQYLEANDEEKISVNNLIQKMKEYLGDKEETFSFPHIKVKT